MSDDSHSHIIREIYKYGWLRVLPPEEKKFTVLPKKVWVVFCIHDETLPYLEIYGDKKIAIMHKPEVSHALNDTLHISPTICPLDGEYEFVVSLCTDSIRLVAPSWNQMLGWIDGISSKLREMKIMSPKENMYMAHLPEVKPPLLPTRDPNSPLPLPPAVPYIPPGVEPVNAQSQGQTTENGNNSRSVSTSLTSRLMLTPEQMTRQTVVVDIEGDDDILTNYNGQIGSRTIIEVPPEYLPFDMFDLNAITEVLRQINHTEQPEVSTEQIETPDIQVVSNNSETNEQNGNRESDSPNENSDNVSHHSGDSSSRTINVESVRSELVEDGNGLSAPDNPNLYEHVFLSSSPNIITINDIRHSPNASQLPRMGRGRAHQRGRRRSNVGGETNSSHIAFGADRIRTTGIPISQRLHPVPHPFGRQQVTISDSCPSGNPLTLREQQVMQLRKEMAHPAGVRLQLRRKDCLSSIALVDAFQAVWIAGWKQKEHPSLYNVLHIGDQLLSIAGKLVCNAGDAQKIIRAWPSLYIEFVIRRVPCGRVFALRRECDGQSLGIIQDGNTAEIKEVIPNSLAASQGLSSRTPTMDGLSLTTWVLTEINARPLNLFYKDNEVRDRLNAVGLDISLLVQPYDLIKQIKKHFKNIKNYKEYIVQ